MKATDTGRVSSWLDGAIQPQFRTIDGLAIRYAESDEREDQALLLSPWPESLYAFEPTWLRLAEAAHLVAVDLPGFGHSQRSDTLLSPRAMGEFVARLVDAFGLDNPHVVGPDIGTGASLFAAALYPGRLRSLVVGSGCAAIPPQLASAVKDWVDSSDLEGYRSGNPREIVGGAPSTYTSGCQTASSTSSTSGISCGRTPRTSTQRWSRAGGAEAT